MRIARDLIGKLLVTNTQGLCTGGIIVETEAYSWKERGCHAYGGKMTERNKIMFAEGGHTYVYLCYGIHHLFNVVTNSGGVADAVLIRAIEPTMGIPVMMKRRGHSEPSFQLTSGPGKLAMSLGIDRAMNGKLLWNDEVWIEGDGIKIASRFIISSKRIGVDYAGADAALPWRFTMKGSRWVSK